MQFMEYELEIERASEEIKLADVKLVCIQLPEGLKPKAGEISKEIEKRTGARVLIWLGSCYGGCDVPFHVERIGVGMLIQWGHSIWAY